MVFLFSLLIHAAPVMAMEFPGCTEWKEQANLACFLAGEQSSVWKRDCSAAEKEFKCRRLNGNRRPDRPCLKEKLCLDENPNELRRNCSDWVKEPGLSCNVSGKTVLWRRACQWEVLPRTACTVFTKQYPTEEDYRD